MIIQELKSESCDTCKSFNSLSEDDLFEFEPVIDPGRETNKQVILEMIQGFEWTLDDSKDMEAFKNLVDQVKKLGNQAFDDFKMLIN